MWKRFDINKWVIQQLPLVLRRTVVYAMFKCVISSFNKVYDRYYAFSIDVFRKLDYNPSNTRLLQKWLNDIFYFSDGVIYLTNYLNDNIYIHYQDETPEEIYIGYQSEGDGIYLSSSEPGSEYGGFVVNVPAEMASQNNLRIIKQWIEYYKAAGTVYRIELYE